MTPTLFMRIHKTAGEALAQQIRERLPGTHRMPRQIRVANTQPFAGGAEAVQLFPGTHQPVRIVAVADERACDHNGSRAEGTAAVVLLLLERGVEARQDRILRYDRGNVAARFPAFGRADHPPGHVERAGPVARGRPVRRRRFAAAERIWPLARGIRPSRPRRFAHWIASPMWGSRTDTMRRWAACLRCWASVSRRHRCGRTLRPPGHRAMPICWLGLMWPRPCRG